MADGIVSNWESMHMLWYQAYENELNMRLGDFEGVCGCELKARWGPLTDKLILTKDSIAL